MKILLTILINLQLINIVLSEETELPYAKYYKVPTDTILRYHKLSFDKKIIITVINKWQSKSYKNENLNCQFYPSCSNYLAKAVFIHNTYWGIVKGIDRVIRCNTSARLYFDNKTYQPKYLIDGRMIDKVLPKYNPTPSKKVFIATSLSLIPGLGRIYSGRYKDGILSFISLTLLSYSSYKKYKNDNYIGSSILGSFTFTFWLSDFYGAYRSARRSK